MNVNQAFVKTEFLFREDPERYVSEATMCVNLKLLLISTSFL